MGNTAKGRYALFISDRSGLQFPYREMVREWNGARVHTSEYEPKQPQLEPRPYSADPQGLQHPRPARTEFPTTDFLPKNPFTMTNTSTQVSVNFPFSGYKDGDFVRFFNVKRPVGGVSISTLELETTLNGNITATDISITLTDSSAFPSQGYIAIEKINETSGLFENETIFYNGNTGNVLSNCVRGTAAPFRGQTPKNTPASAHSSGAKICGAYPITMVPTVVKQAGQPPTVTQRNSFTFNLISAATSTETGGGFECLAGPVNNNFTEYRSGGGYVPTPVTPTQTYAVTVATGTLYIVGGTGNAFYLDGSRNMSLSLAKNTVITFSQDNSNNDGHPLFITTSNSTNLSTLRSGIVSSNVAYYLDGSSNSSAYTNTTTFNAASTRYLQWTPSVAGTYYYACYIHGIGMGGMIQIT